MATPTVEATNTSNQSPRTSHTVNLPASIAAGDLLLALFSQDGSAANETTWPAGWTEMFDVLGGDDTNVFSAAYRQADGDEGVSITVTTTNSVGSGHNTYRISGAENPATRAPESATSTATNAAPDPPNLTPTGGAKDYLWIAATGYNGGADPTTSAPTNYTNLIEGVHGGSGTDCSSGRRALNASSENPGTFTTTDDEAALGSAATFAIHPAPPIPVIDLTMAPYTPA